MSKYRINVRFDTDDPKQAEAVKFLQFLEHSRNAFIVSAVLDAISSHTAPNSITLEEIRRIIQEELQEVSFVTVPPVSHPVKTELTEEEQAKNEKSVLDDLEMFG
jgi:hypothetical protein